MANKAQVTGHMTISNSNKLANAVKERILDAPDGHVRVFRKRLIDPDTNKEVVITGKARLSKGGRDGTGPKSLTSYIAFKLEGVESLLVEEDAPKQPQKDVDVDALAASLGLEEAAE